MGITGSVPFPPRMAKSASASISPCTYRLSVFHRIDIVEVQPQLSSAHRRFARGISGLLKFRTASGVSHHINTNWLTPFKVRKLSGATRGNMSWADLLTRR